MCGRSLATREFDILGWEAFFHFLTSLTYLSLDPLHMLELLFFIFIFLRNRLSEHHDLGVVGRWAAS